MKSNVLPGPGKVAWQGNKPFLLYIAGLLFILSFLKIIFYQYNYTYIFGARGETLTWQVFFQLCKWSLLTDLAVLLTVNGSLLLLLWLGRLLPPACTRWILLPVFSLLNSLVILLNLADVFYFPFHFQRANADLLYALAHPIGQLISQPLSVITGITGFTLLVLFTGWKMTGSFIKAFIAGKRSEISTVLIVFILFFTFLGRSYMVPRMLPTYPLVELNSSRLMVVQNSFHTLLYSLFRNEQTVDVKNYMPQSTCDSLLPLKKIISVTGPDTPRKNIVLFIMESVPYDFFDPASPYKVKMPFFDSLLKKSSLYTHAFCFAHQSTKGITALLAGVPTLTDIPLYHSPYVNLPLTPIGSTLKKKGYQSFFCIGDRYDNFGFAKCANWLGFDAYYSEEDIPGYRDLPSHPMGIQDEYVLDFFGRQIDHTGSPFFAVHYNISTHYPYTLPRNFKGDFPPGTTDPMKSMSYYDQSLGKFFAKAATEPWYSNTVFLFCSDHWLTPDDRHTEFNAINGYRIPIILFDPSKPVKQVYTAPVSQFDVMGTILALSGYRDSLISFGTRLNGNEDGNRVVFSRANASLYHAMDSAYVLGFNRTNDRAEFLYHYTADPALSHDLLKDNTHSAELQYLTLHMKAFLQQAGKQYNRRSFQ